MLTSRRQFLASSITTAAGAGTLAADQPDSATRPAVPNCAALDLSFMVWRIGELLDFDAQVRWIADAGFESVSFHASAGIPGKWRGIDPISAGPAERRRIRKLLSRFRIREIHAPFDAAIQPATPSAVLEKLEAVLEFAGDVGATIVTVHVEPPALEGKAAPNDWHRTLDRLDAAAARTRTFVGLEFFTGFEWLRRPRRERIGATLDVGHMYLNDGRGYRPYGTIGDQIRTLGDTLLHMHVHDYRDGVDHIEVGTGVIDFDSVLRAMCDIRYREALCLELNPDRVSPEGIRRSARVLRECAERIG